MPLTLSARPWGPRRRSFSSNRLNGSGGTAHSSETLQGMNSHLQSLPTDSVSPKAADQEVKYDLQVFADRIEFCWIHLRGIGALENSLWAYDAHGMRIWLTKKFYFVI